MKLTLSAHSRFDITALSLLVYCGFDIMTIDVKKNFWLTF